MADGTRARILRGLEPGAPEPAPQTELVSRSRSQHLREIMSDKPGRTQSSDHSGRRSAMEYGSDPIRRDMRDFARDIMDHLDIHRRARDLERLAIFAVPDMLGILREVTPKTLAGTIILERPVNLVFLGEAELRVRVLAELGNVQDGMNA